MGNVPFRMAFKGAPEFCSMKQVYMQSSQLVREPVGLLTACFPQLSSLELPDCTKFVFDSLTHSLRYVNTMLSHLTLHFTETFQQPDPWEFPDWLSSLPLTHINIHCRGQRITFLLDLLRSLQVFQVLKRLDLHFVPVSRLASFQLKRLFSVLPGVETLNYEGYTASLLEHTLSTFPCGKQLKELQFTISNPATCSGILLHSNDFSNSLKKLAVQASNSAQEEPIVVFNSTLMNLTSLELFLDNTNRQAGSVLENLVHCAPSLQTLRLSACKNRLEDLHINTGLSSLCGCVNLKELWLDLDGNPKITYPLIRVPQSLQHCSLRLQGAAVTDNWVKYILEEFNLVADVLASPRFGIDLVVSACKNISKDGVGLVMEALTLVSMVQGQVLSFDFDGCLDEQECLEIQAALAILPLGDNIVLYVDPP